MKKNRIKLKWEFRQFYQRLFYWLEWRISDERHDPYRCEECGSTDVEIKAWIKINEGGRYASDCEDFDRSYCNNCNENVRVRPTSALLNYAEEWWNITDICTREAVTGIAVAAFAAEDVRDGFDYACDKFWNKLSDAEKIEKWLNN